MTSAAIDALAVAVSSYEHSAAGADAGISSQVSANLSTLHARRDALIAEAERARGERARAAAECAHRRADLAAVPPDRDDSRARSALRLAEDELTAARQHEHDAEQRADRAEAVVRQVEEAIANWQGARSTWQNERRLLVGRATARLRRAGRSLRLYEGASAAGEPVPSTPAAPMAATGTGPPTVVQAPGLPNGFALVPISAIDTSGSTVGGPTDFRGSHSATDLTWAVEKFFDVVLPALARGNTRDDLVARDAAAGMSGIRSLAGTFDGFLGNDAPRLTRRPDGLFGVTNGYHRLWCAQQLGYDHLPARLA